MILFSVYSPCSAIRARHLNFGDLSFMYIGIYVVRFCDFLTCCTFFSRFNGKEDISYCLLVILTGPFTFPQRNYTTKRKIFPFKLRSSVTRSHLSGCLMSFCSKILGGGGDLWIIILLKNECSFSDGDMQGGGGTQPLKDGKKIELCTLRGGGDVKAP